MNKGIIAEKIALKWLLERHLSLVDSNYRCRFGEIDLIMLDQEILVFIEVRLRSSANFGGAASSVTHKKQQKIITTASHFLMQNKKYRQYHCRFDVIAFESSTAENCPLWYKDAFRL